MLMEKIHGNVRPWTSDQRDEIISSAVKNLPKTTDPVSFEVAQKLVTKPATFKRKLREIFFPGGNGLVKNVPDQYPEFLLEFHEGWVEFYRNFGIKIDLNDFPLPRNLFLKEGQSYWSILVPEGFNPQRAFEIMKQITATYEYTSVAKIVDVYPQVKVSIICANKNARVEYPNISLNKSIELGLFGTTFTEGCLIDRRIFNDMGVHLDVDGWTLHTGSRNGYGDAIRSGWSDDGYLVYWYGPVNCGSGVSLRQKQF